MPEHIICHDLQQTVTKVSSADLVDIIQRLVVLAAQTEGLKGTALVISKLKNKPWTPRPSPRAGVQRKSARKQCLAYLKNKNDSSEANCFRYINCISMNVKEVYIVYFVDLEKAFVRVDWNKLMVILKKIGVDWKERRLFSNLYMKQRVKMRNRPVGLIRELYDDDDDDDDDDDLVLTSTWIAVHTCGVTVSASGRETRFPIGASYLVVVFSGVFPQPNMSKCRMWFMYDGAPAHFLRIVREHLTLTFQDRWIGRGSPTPWPARSPNLNPLDFWLWGHMKEPGQFQRVRDSLRQRAEECIVMNGHERGVITCGIGASVCAGVGGGEAANATTKSPLTGIPQIDYVLDPNLPRELNGYNLTDYPFYDRVPDEIDFKCDGLHDGFYASIPHKCQAREWGKLHNTELHALYSSPGIIRNIKSRRLRWAGHITRMGESRNAYRVLVGRPEGKRPLGRPRRTWEDNIKMDLREMGYNGRDWINLVQDRDRWRAYVRAAMNLRVP
ncbi:hypothetical protein ANN_20740 [Periplaneta americana]|uniref:Reverse transcriptase domain-containing protein n=1 Tax=Periplaneta americana TaxID=6978 RepID=A0ABQ8SE45_PERAM|nr:hypothetical protein ANN_20740 [Periplaneta americana]